MNSRPCLCGEAWKRRLSAPHLNAKVRAVHQPENLELIHPNSCASDGILTSWTWQHLLRHLLVLTPLPYYQASLQCRAAFYLDNCFRRSGHDLHGSSCKFSGNRVKIRRPCPFQCYVASSSPQSHSHFTFAKYASFQRVY